MRRLSGTGQTTAPLIGALFVPGNRQLFPRRFGYFMGRQFYDSAIELLHIEEIVFISTNINQLLIVTKGKNE
jgi:hypothetical protein